MIDHSGLPWLEESGEVERYIKYMLAESTTLQDVDPERRFGLGRFLKNYENKELARDLLSGRLVLAKMYTNENRFMGVGNQYDRAGKIIRTSFKGDVSPQTQARLKDAAGSNFARAGCLKDAAHAYTKKLGFLLEDPTATEESIRETLSRVKKYANEVGIRIWRIPYARDILETLVEKGYGK